jgi:hypothetical protein
MLSFQEHSPYNSGDLLVFYFNPRCKHDIFRLFIIFKSTFFNDETVDVINNVIDINSLLYGVA